MAKIHKSKSTTLTQGRPPVFATTSSTSHTKVVNARRRSAKATRKLINTHHQLQKSKAVALASGNLILVKDIDDQLQSLGGLSAYQDASLTGQDKDRGGDSSVKLVEWLRKHGLIAKFNKSTDTPSQGLRVLEIGALSSTNAISQSIGSGIEEVKRIDLHSQDPSSIEEIDFMAFPIPISNEAKYDVVSLSLVLNFVPDVSQRGAMLRHTTQFLRNDVPVLSKASSDEQPTSKSASSVLPCLFVVLPLPCLENSRYMTQPQFIAILGYLGYDLIESHNSQKLSYMLLRWRTPVFSESERPVSFRKSELRSGKSRNNFAVILDSE